MAEPPTAGTRGRRTLAGLALGLLLPLGARAGELEVLPGSAAWLAATELAGMLPGRPVSPEGEQQVLVEVLAVPGVIKARKAIERFDFDGLRAAMSDLLHGAPGTLSRAGALRAATQLVPSPAAPWNGLPTPFLPREFEEYAEARRAALATASGTTGAGREKLAAFIQREPRELASRLPGLRVGEIWPGGFVAGGGLSVPSLLAVIPGSPAEGPAPPNAPAAVKVQSEAIAAAWGRRAQLHEGLVGHRLHGPEQGAAIKGRRIRIAGQLAQDGAGEPARPTVSLAGGRLGTQTLGADLRFALDCELGRLAPILADPGSLVLQVVQNRDVVLSRALGSDRVFSLREQKGDPKLRVADLGILRLPVRTAQVVVAMPGFRDLLLRTESEEEVHPTTALVRLSGHPAIEALGDDGSFRFGELPPGLKVASISLTDASGEVVARALGSVLAKAGVEAKIVLALPVGKAPVPTRASAPEKVRGLMEDLVGRYKKGEFGPEALKAGIGEIYRLHRAVTGDAAKDKAFATKAAEAMAAVMRELDDERAKRDPAPAISALEAQFQEMAELLPDLLRSDRPAERLRAYLDGSVARAFPPVPAEEHRSTVHRRRVLQESAETISELDGLVQFLEDVLQGRFARLQAATIGCLAAFKDAEPLLRLAGSADYEERLLHLVEERLLPLEDLVGAGARLKSSLFGPDLKDRLADESAEVSAAEARLRALGEVARVLKKGLEVPAGKAGAALAALDGRKPAWSPWVAWVAEFGRNPQAEPGSRSQAETVPATDLPRVWTTCLARAQREVEPLGAAEDLLAEAARWHSAYDKLLRGRLAEFHDLDAGPERLKELAVLDPLAREQAVSLAMPTIYDRLKPAPLPALAWGPGLPRRLEPKVRAVVARWIEDWTACAAWRERARVELDRLDGLLATPDPDPGALVGAFLPLAERRDAWGPPVLWMIEDPVGKELGARLTATEGRLKALVAKPSAWARLAPPWPGELARRGYPAPAAPEPAPAPSTPPLTSSPPVGPASGPSPVPPGP